MVPAVIPTATSSIHPRQKVALGAQDANLSRSVQTESLRLCLPNHPLFGAELSIKVVDRREEDLQAFGIFRVFAAIKGHDLVVAVVQAFTIGEGEVAFMEGTGNVLEGDLRQLVHRRRSSRYSQACH
jgi:hypothetical protein